MYVGLISNSNVVKSPTLVAVAPALTLAPFELNLNCSLSGKPALAAIAQNTISSPFWIVTCGENNQLLKVAVPEPDKKAHPLKSAPECEGKEPPVVPWYQSLNGGTPAGLLRFCCAHPAGNGAELNPSVSKLVNAGGALITAAVETAFTVAVAVFEQPFAP